MISHLLFMRHAQASWTEDTLSDHARALSKRGHKEADIVAKTLIARGYAPDIIWASTAQRTQETARRLIRIIEGPQVILKVPEFYNSSAAQVLSHIQTAQEPNGNLMLLGHNPGWSELASHFTGRAENMPTAMCFVFKRRHPGENWLSPKSWRLIDEIIAGDLLGS